MDSECRVVVINALFKKATHILTMSILASSSKPEGAKAELSGESPRPLHPHHLTNVPHTLGLHWWHHGHHIDVVLYLWSVLYLSTLLTLKYSGMRTKVPQY